MKENKVFDLIQQIENESFTQGEKKELVNKLFASNFSFEYRVDFILYHLIQIIENRLTTDPFFASSKTQEIPLGEHTVRTMIGLQILKIINI